MIPLFQSDSSAKTGDCMSACLASILEVDPKSIPKFLETDRHLFWPNVKIWCRTAHHKVLEVYAGLVQIRGYSILGYELGLSPHAGQRFCHAIIAKDGKPVHCPVSGVGFKALWWVTPSRVLTTSVLLNNSYDINHMLM